MQAGPKIVLVTTHPIQYQVCWYRELVAAGAELLVVFGCVPDARTQGTGFGVSFTWDTPLFVGYSWRSLERGGETNLETFFGVPGFGIADVLSDVRPDAVLVTGWNSVMLVRAALSAKLLAIPVIVRGDSNDLRPRSGMTQAGHRALMTLYDGFLTVGVANRRFYELNGVRAERIAEGGHFVDVGFFETEAQARSARRKELRASWGIGDHETCVLFAGKLEEKKRPLFFLRAVAAARSMGASVRALVAGSGPLEGAMREVAGREGVPVTFAGFLNQTEVVSAYVAADVLCLPSDFGETWGLVANEGMLCGLPVVVSDRVGCGPDLVVEGETGHIVPFEDLAAAARALNLLASDENRRRRMGAQARARARLYSPTRAAREALSLVNRMAGGS